MSPVVLTFLGAAPLAPAQKYQITDLGVLGGLPSQNYYGYVNAPVAITASGVVLGNSTDASGSSHPFVWKEGQRIDIGLYNGQSTTATAINASGTVVGNGFVWSNGSYKALPG
jgi:probable HAF family extracellular repeat protein